MSSLTGLGGDIAQIGGAVGALFTSEGNAAEANSYSSAAQLEEQNAQLTAASTKIQALQTARTVSQSLGTTQADVAGAGFTESGSALDILKSSAQQGSLATSLINIQGAINENAYAAEAGADLAKAKAANEAQTAGTISAIASIGGALVSGGTQLASAGNTVSKAYNYVFGGDSLASSAGVSQSAGVFVNAAGDSVAEGTPGAIQLTSEQAATLAQTGEMPALSGAQSLTDVSLTDGAAVNTGGIGDAIVGGFSDVVSGVSDALSALATVLCTALYKQGMVSRSLWVATQRYGQRSNPRTFAGYLLWATPIARMVTKYKWFARLVAPVFIPPLREEAVRTGLKVKRTLYGRISFRVLYGLSWTLGWVATALRYKPVMNANLKKGVVL